MTWAKKKKMIFLFSSVSAVLVVPQLVSIPLYMQLANNNSDNILNVANRAQKDQLQLNGENSSRLVNSNKDQNLEIVNPPKTPIVVEIPPKTLPPKMEEKPEEKPEVIIPIVPPPLDDPALIPIKPLPIPTLPIAEIPVPKVEPVKPEPEEKPEEPPVVVVPAVTEPIVTPVPTEVKPEPVVTPPVVTPAPVIEPVKPVENPPTVNTTPQPPAPVVQPLENPRPIVTRPNPRPPQIGTFLPGENEEVITSGITLFLPDPNVRTVTSNGTVITGGDKTIIASFRAITRKPNPRRTFTNSSDKEIANRVPYTADVASDIVSLELSSELISKLKESYSAILKFRIKQGVDGINHSGKAFDDIDFDNLKLSQEALDNIKKGNTLNTGLRDLFLDEQGNINSTGNGPISNMYNNTVSLYARDNEKYRTFGYKEWYPRTSDQIYSGDFPGWQKEDVKNDWLRFGLSKTDGIEVYKYTTSDPAFSKNNNSIRVVLDAKNQEGYDKYINFLRNVAADPSRKITSFEIKNMGLGTGGANQRFKHILEALPNEITNLVLWLEQPTATSYLEVLRHKKIDELSLFTTQNSLREDWSINPFAVQNTAFITWQDYNVSSSFQKGYVPATRVNISTLVFDPDNYKAGTSDPYKELNEGLRMAYLVRNNERFFQGLNGPGVGSRDNNESGNTAWPNLDLSRIPQLKSLRGLNFSFVDGSGNSFTRKVVKLKLYNDSPTFTITTDELNNSNFYAAMQLSTRGPSNRLSFSGTKVQDMRVVSNGVELTAEGVRNLQTFYRDVGKDIFEGKPILVNPNDKKAEEALKKSGFNVTLTSEDTVTVN